MKLVTMKLASLFYPRERATQREIMDDPESDRELLELTLRQLRVVNRVLTRMQGLLRRYILRDLAERGEHSATVLDVGAGGGDIALRLAEDARRRGIALEITCLDNDPRIVEFARHHVGDHPAVSVVEGSALEITGSYDYVICNHVLHHLPGAEIGLFLSSAFMACRRRLLVNDLLRSRVSMAGFWLVATLFLRGGFSRKDGITSIRKGFLPQELRVLAESSEWGLPGIERTVRRLVPGRVVLVATRQGSYSQSASSS
jgi:2-polyprenyl-3-methyl-5-hydroxy-6-metoxy-1,4-benzoquinol methylase